MSALQADPSALNEFFNKMAERLVGQNAITDDIISDLDLATSSHNSFKLQKVTCNDVLKSFKSLLFNRIGQNPSFLYQTNSRIHCLTFNIHNQQFNWRIEIAYVNPIRKVSNQKELKDYRPISILLILSKVYEKRVLHQITDFVEPQQVYNKHQSGYRRNHSTATIFSKLYGDVKMAMKQSLQWLFLPIIQKLLIL